MADRGQNQETPRRSASSSSDKKRQRREDDLPRGESKKRKEDVGLVPQQCDDGAPPPAVAGTSHSVNSAPTGEGYDRLNCLLTSLIEKLEKNDEPVASQSGFGGSHDLSWSEGEDGEIPVCLPDPLNDLNALGPAHQGDADADSAEFLQALDEFSGIFHGEEKKGDLLSDCLASILNASLRCRPSTEGVKTACSRIKIPSNVPNKTVPVTNTAITKAMSVGGKL